MGKLSLPKLRERLERREDILLLDVREPEEVCQGTIPGATVIPLAHLSRQASSLLPDANTQIVAYCAEGTRAAVAAEILGNLGYTHVEHAAPGFTDWRRLGYPVAGGDDASPPNTPNRSDERYSRQMLLSEIGVAGQERLRAGRVLVVGAGGLGSPAAIYLAAAGVGSLGIVDDDTVDLSNLQRQIVHATARVGARKTDSAARMLAELNPEVSVVGHEERLDAGNAERLLAQYDLVIDGSDNFATRYVLNDASVRLGRPLVHASVFRFEAQVTTFLPRRAAQRFSRKDGPCYRCLFPEPPPPSLAPNCQRAGVLGAVCGVVGTIQATEAIKLLLGCGELLIGRLLTFDALSLRFRELGLDRDPECPVCSERQ